MEQLGSIDWVGFISALMLIIVGFFIAKRVSSTTERALSRKFSRHQSLLARRLVFYGLFFIFAFSGLQQLGFKLTVLLGAAGVFTVALSFASQTAASNLVSGLFLIFESPFKVGDQVKIKDISGTVDSIDLLSTKIQTTENICVRIPNETIIKSDIQNMSYFKTRRVDIIIGVSYKNNIDAVKTVLINLAKAHDQVLLEPVAQVIINSFGESAVELKWMVWTNTVNASNVRNQLYERLKEQFDIKGIEIPYPQFRHQKQ